MCCNHATSKVRLKLMNDQSQKTVGLDQKLFIIWHPAHFSHAFDSSCSKCEFSTNWFWHDSWMRYDSGNIFFEIPPLAIDNNDIVSVCPKKKPTFTWNLLFFNLWPSLCQIHGSRSFLLLPHLSYHHPVTHHGCNCSRIYPICDVVIQVHYVIWITYLGLRKSIQT